jgi:diketogulonate reductase-like aldo/keto reductase
MKLVESIKEALAAGCTHLDLAEMYGTDDEVAAALAEAKLPRDSLFITHKLLKSLPDVAGPTRRMMANLNTEYLDLLLIHAPFLPTEAEGKLEQIWQEMEALVDSNVVRAIGVSNFRMTDLQYLLSFARIKPAVNQIEVHPYLPQPDLVKFCKANQIQVAGYSGLMSLTRKKGGPLDPIVQQLAQSKGVSEAQVLMSWGLQKDLVIVTTSSKPDRLAECIQVASSEPLLSPEEINAIDSAGLGLSHREFWKKEFGAV